MKPSELVLADLKKLKSDFAIMRTDFLSPDVFNITPLVTDRLVALVAERHPLAGRRRVSLTELKNERFILPPQSVYICVNACLKASFANVIYAVSGKPEIVAAL